MSKLNQEEAIAYLELQNNPAFRTIMRRWAGLAEQEQLALQTADKDSMQVHQGRCQIYTQIFAEAEYAQKAVEEFKAAASHEQESGVTI